MPRRYDEGMVQLAGIVGIALVIALFALVLGAMLREKFFMHE